jgi:sphingolipid 4-desaturase/C4-monooxygenase
VDVEVHKRRQRAILAEQPGVKKLYGYDRRTQYYAYGVIVAQLVLAYLCRGSFARAVVLGCTLGPYVDAMALCFIHEATHMLVFATPMYNRLLSIATNMVMVMPLSEIFKQHHSAHHKNLGDDSYDVDVPTAFEVKLVGNSSLGKAVWLTFNMIILPVRSLSRLPVHTDRYLVLNWVVCLSFGAASFAYSRSAFLFLILSLLQSQGLHPANTRQVQEHLYDGDAATRASDDDLRAPTYSYYGRQNAITLRVGMHTEHHDFPRIPWTRLPALRATAGEKWYPSTRAHASRGFSSLLNFVLNPRISLADFAQ